MNQENELEKDGYYETKAEYESLLRKREFVMLNLADFRGEDKIIAEATLSEIDRLIPDVRSTLEKQYAALEKLVEARRDPELSREALLGQFQKFADALKDADPPMAKWLHSAVEGKDPGPMPKPNQA